MIRYDTEVQTNKTNGTDKQDIPEHEAPLYLGGDLARETAAEVLGMEGREVARCECDGRSVCCGLYK